MLETQKDERPMSFMQQGKIKHLLYDDYGMKEFEVTKFMSWLHDANPRMWQASQIIKDLEADTFDFNQVV